MIPVALSDVIAVGEVPTAAEIEILAKAGFRSLLNTQPDGEVERLMSSTDAKILAGAAGLAYQHLPIPSRRPDETSLAAFAEAIATLPRPIYACCYSGARSAAAWALVAAPHAEPDAIIEACTKAGYDVSFLKPKLAERRAQAAKPATVPIAAILSTKAAPLTVAVPALQPSVLLPRAASAGGFAVAG